MASEVQRQPEMCIDLALRLVEIEVCQLGVVGTGPRDQDVVQRGREVAKEPLEEVEIGGIEGGGGERVELGGGALEGLGIAGGEDDAGPFSVGLAGSFKTNTGAAADDKDSLTTERRAALDGRGIGLGAHRSSNRQSFPAFMCVTGGDEFAIFERC
jgi:hypothetical protein